jgi:hypothetical protein
MLTLNRIGGLKFGPPGAYAAEVFTPFFTQQ